MDTLLLPSSGMKSATVRWVPGPVEVTGTGYALLHCHIMPHSDEGCIMKTQILDKRWLPPGLRVVVQTLRNSESYREMMGRLPLPTCAGACRQLNPCATKCLTRFSPGHGMASLEYPESCREPQ